MNINRAGKQTKAYWRAQEKHRAKWEAEKPITDAEKAYGQYLRTEERLQGHAAGWIDGVNWMRRQRGANDQDQRPAGAALPENSK